MADTGMPVRVYTWKKMAYARNLYAIVPATVMCIPGSVKVTLHARISWILTKVLLLPLIPLSEIMIW
jgi:hypothetical protein